MFAVAGGLVGCADASDRSGAGPDPAGVTSLGGTADGGLDDGQTESMSSGDDVKLDVGSAADGTAGSCAPDDPCCQPGAIPTHAVLETFLAAYPAATMPKDHVAIQAFMPAADGHTMAWSDENVGGELVDPANGGPIEANIATGRDLSRAAAELAMPAGATVLDMREDPVVIEVLPGPIPQCQGVGWAWGSILFEAPDLSIGELVYLYLGMCGDPNQDGDSEDIEVFFYSEDAVEICAAPG
jgi:hypothetical protein